jgi:hypothetical protein
MMLEVREYMRADQMQNMMSSLSLFSIDPPPLGPKKPPVNRLKAPPLLPPEVRGRKNEER